MCLQKLKSIRRYDVSGSRRLSNYWWSAFSLIGGFSFFTAGLYSYFFYFFSESNFTEKTGVSGFFLVLKNIIQIKPQILFFPQGLAMCFYGLIGIILGLFLWFCIFFQIGCGFTEFNKEKETVRIFRLGFPGKNRFIDYTYNLNNIICICVKLPSGIVGTETRGVYMRLKGFSENQTRDIPLDLYSEKTSLEEVESRAADLSKFLRVSLSYISSM